MDDQNRGYLTTSVEIVINSDDFASSGGGGGGEELNFSCTFSVINRKKDSRSRRDSMRRLRSMACRVTRINSCGVT